MVLNLKIKKIKKKSRNHGTGRTAEWNDLKFCKNNQYTKNWPWLVFGRNRVKTDRILALLKKFNF